MEQEMENKVYLSLFGERLPKKLGKKKVGFSSSNKKSHGENLNTSNDYEIPSP